MIIDNDHMMKGDRKVGQQKYEACISVKNTKSSVNGDLFGGSRNVTIHVDICRHILVKAREECVIFYHENGSRERQ